MHNIHGVGAIFILSSPFLKSTFDVVLKVINIKLILYFYCFFFMLKKETEKDCPFVLFTRIWKNSRWSKKVFHNKSKVLQENIKFNAQ